MILLGLVKRWRSNSDRPQGNFVCIIRNSKQKYCLKNVLKTLPHEKQIVEALSTSDSPLTHTEVSKISQQKWQNLQELKCVLPLNCNLKSI